MYYVFLWRFRGLQGFYIISLVSRFFLSVSNRSCFFFKVRLRICVLFVRSHLGSSCMPKFFSFHLDCIRWKVWQPGWMQAMSRLRIPCRNGVCLQARSRLLAIGWSVLWTTSTTHKPSFASMCMRELLDALCSYPQRSPPMHPSKTSSGTFWVSPLRIPLGITCLSGGILAYWSTTIMVSRTIHSRGQRCIRWHARSSSTSVECAASSSGKRRIAAYRTGTTVVPFASCLLHLVWRSGWSIPLASVLRHIL